MTTAVARGARAVARDAWQQRALALADGRHLFGTPRQVGTNAHGAAIWQVPSRSSDGTYYIVKVWPVGDVGCSCTAGSYARPCAHAGAVIKAEAQREAVQAATQDEGMRYWLNGGEW
jgi:hypothetical protein